MTTFTPNDQGTYTFTVYDAPFDCDPIEEFDFNGTLESALDWAQTIAYEGYEVDVYADNTIVAWVDDIEVSIAGQYAA